MHCNNFQSTPDLQLCKFLGRGKGLNTIKKKNKKKALQILMHPFQTAKQNTHRQKASNRPKNHMKLKVTLLLLCLVSKKGALLCKRKVKEVRIETIHYFYFLI